MKVFKAVFECLAIVGAMEDSDSLEICGEEIKKAGNESEPRTNASQMLTCDSQTGGKGG